MAKLQTDPDLQWDDSNEEAKKRCERMLAGTVLAKLLDPDLLASRQWKPSTDRHLS